jgi:hypothetical protein
MFRLQSTRSLGPSMMTSRRRLGLSPAHVCRPSPFGIATAMHSLDLDFTHVRLPRLAIILCRHLLALLEHTRTRDPNVMTAAMTMLLIDPLLYTIALNAHADRLHARTQTCLEYIDLECSWTLLTLRSRELVATVARFALGCDHFEQDSSQSWRRFDAAES